MEAMNRFASVTTEEIKEKKTNNICSKNTIKANRKAAKIIKDYLTEKNMNPNFEKRNWTIFMLFLLEYF